MATADKKKLTYSQGSDEVYSTVCLPCYREDTTIPAVGYCMDCKEHLCQNCYKYHKKATPCRHHKLQDKANMPSIQQLTDTPVLHDPTNKLTTPCLIHNGEMIKLYCRDHSLLLCSVCVALEHTKPCHVDYIPDISKKMINSLQYKDAIDGMIKLVKKCTTAKTKTTKDTKKSNDSLKAALQDFQKFRQDIDHTLDDLQKDIEDKIHALQQQNEEKMNTEAELCDDVQNKAQAIHDNIIQLNTTKQADKLFLEVKQAVTRLHDFENNILSITTADSTEEYKFIPNHAINNVLQKEKKIGDLSTKHPKRKSHMVTSPPMTLKYNGEICVKAAEDGVRCWIADMVSLPPDRLVVTDWLQNAIKLVDVKSKSITSQLTLGKDQPSHIAIITDTKVAVTVPSRQLIQLVSVSNKLRKMKTILTDGECYGICYYDDKLIVTYKNPGKLEILDMIGRVTKKLNFDSIGLVMFMEPEYVQANSSAIYVSDDWYKEVIMLNWQGEIKGRCGDMKSPSGLALLSDGSILVCDFGRHRLLQLSGDCTYSKIVLEHVRFPLTACVDDNGYVTLYISSGTGTAITDNNIRVYNIT